MDFDAIIIKNRVLYLSYFYNRCDSFDLSQDLYQDLFLKVKTELNKGKVFEVEKAFLCWVWRVANSVFIDHVREKNRACKTLKVWHEEFTYYDFIPDEGLNPEEELIRSEMHEKIKIAVEELPEEQREVYKMRALDDIRFKVISDITGRGINTVLGQMRYARINLKKSVYPCN